GRNGTGGHVIIVNGLKDNSDYDVFLMVFWIEPPEKCSYKIENAKFLIMSKEAVDKLKDSDSAGNHFIRFTPSDRAPLFKVFKHFVFDIDTVIKLNEMDYSDFKREYLDPAFEKAYPLALKTLRRF